MIYDDDAGQFYIFYVDKEGYLCVNSIYSSVQAFRRISSAPILEESFEVTRDLENGGMIVYYLEDKHTEYLKYSDDGRRWHIFFGSFIRDRELGRWTSIAYGLPHNTFVAHSYDNSSTPNYEIEVFLSQPTFYGSVVKAVHEVLMHTDNTWFDYNPIVVAANKDNSGVWVIYGSEKPYSVGVSVFSRYSPDAGEHWLAEETEVVPPTIASSAANIYLSDAKPLKIKPNGYIDLVYTVRTRDGDIRAYWAWTHTLEPNIWHVHIQFNDRKILIGRGLTSNDQGPKIVYSPGADKPGGGVVFSYYDEGGLYFDAPWNNLTTPTTYTLTVTVEGSGRVVSSPSGINCSNNEPNTSKTCSYGFTAAAAVTLIATPLNGTLSSGTPYTSYFAGWSGACSGNVNTCTITMDAEKEVTAGFAYLVPPVAVMPLPTGTEVFNYLPVENPVKDLTPSNARPIGVGNISGGTLNIQVGLYQFAGPVDVYFAVYAPSVDSENIYLLTQDGRLQPLSAGIVPWKSNVSDEIDESIFGDILSSALPQGTYYLWLAVTPAGEGLVKYYLWGTYFVIP